MVKRRNKRRKTDFQRKLLFENIFRIFLNETTGNVHQLGDTIKMHALAKTLKEIAEHGVDIFYKGSMGTKVVEDTQRRGGIVTKDDLLHYRFEFSFVIKTL